VVERVHKIKGKYGRQLRPAGSQRSQAPLGSKEYFEDVKTYRYGYENPFISRLFCFNQLEGKKILEVGVGRGSLRIRPKFAVGRQLQLIL
jgi:hypothetical protein